MFSQPFYHQLTKKTIVAFGQLFSNIKVQRFNNEGNREQLIDVPVSYGNREKWYQRLQEEASIEQRVLISMPRIGFEIVGIKYDPSRRLNRLTQFRSCNPTLAGNFLSAYSPVPYVLTFNVYILTKTQDDMFQIIEQIIPYFGPQYNLTINAIPNLEIVQDIPITLDGIAMNDTYEGPLENRREVISTLTFSAKNEYLGAIKDDSDTIILKTQVDIKTPSNSGTRVTTFVNGTFDDYEILENYFPIFSNQVDTTFRFSGISTSIGSAFAEAESTFYSLTRSVSSVNEGESFSITFSTSQPGSFPYTITGVSSDDIGGASLTGTISNGSVLTFTVSEDLLTEGEETFTLSLDGGQASVSVTINDTSIEGDPYATNVSILMNMDGTDGSTTFIDQSATPKVVTTSGNAQISTSVVKYGTGSAYVTEATNSQVRIQPAGDLLLTGDFTIEFWFYPISKSTTEMYPLGWGTGPVGYTAFGAFTPAVSPTSGTISLVATVSLSAGGIPLNAWSHIAFSRTGNTTSLFVDGILKSSVNNLSSTIGNNSSAWIINGYNAGGGAFGTFYMDDLRVTNGIGRYTANFTPPTEGF